MNLDDVKLQTNHALQIRDVYAIAIAPDATQDGSLFLAGETLYRSMDNRQHWDLAYAGLESLDHLPTTAVALSPHFAIDGTIVAALPGAVLRSTDQGCSWKAVHLPTPSPTISALAISPAYDHDGIILGGTIEDGILRSADFGRTWSAWNFGLIDLGVIAIVISPLFEEDETVFVGTGSALYNSTNGGRSWQTVEMPWDFESITCLAALPTPAEPMRMLVGTQDQGLWTYDPQHGTWHECLAYSSIGKSVEACFVNPAQPYVLAATEDSLWASTNGGETWSMLSVTLPENFAISAVAAPFGRDKNAPIYIGSIGAGLLIIE